MSSVAGTRSHHAPDGDGAGLPRTDTDAQRTMAAGMRVHATVADGERLPFAVPQVVLETRESYDWEAALPAAHGTARWRLAQGIKRGLDVVLSLGGLIVLLPFFAVIAVVIAIDSPGPIFYPWRVLGRRARPFVGYKFRTMVDNADALKDEYLDHNEMSGPVFKMRNDPRITRVGRWLRKFSIDELPQLWSVLKGDMSLVGPRPPSAEEFAAFEPWQHAKLSVTPGITCLWQVEGRSEITDFDEWAELDLKYIAEWSLGLDLVILARTVPVVIRGRGAY